MKVGIDGVLLGCWANVDNTQHILDIGTGTGLIALMLAQRSNASIDAIDIDEDAVIQAAGNIKNSPWPDRINVQYLSLQNLAETAGKEYDLIVSNPPYFVNSLKSPDLKRQIARHTDMLTHEEIILAAKKLLAPTGRLCLVLPVFEGLMCMLSAKKNELYCTKAIKVLPTPDSLPKRVLLEFSKEYSECSESDLTIENGKRHQYSPEFAELAKDFYLKL